MLSLNGIKNIIFDFGGVIINIDYTFTISEFKKLGIDDFDQFFTQHRQLPWFDQLDRGLISGEHFVDELRKYLPDHVTAGQVVHAWTAMLGDLPQERVDVLSKLRKKYRTFLLSNTNEIHLNYYFDKLHEWYGIHDLSPYFEKEYYSHIVGMRKPDAEIFEFVLKENNLKREETLFIDDTLSNIDAAGKLGFKTHFLQKPETIVDLFS